MRDLTALPADDFHLQSGHLNTLPAAHCLTRHPAWLAVAREGGSERDGDHQQ